jgi:hypothetical protein
MTHVESLPARPHPVDRIEQIAAANDWPFERANDDEITVAVGGEWSDYHLSITWMDTLEALHVACSFEMKVPPPRRAEVHRLLTLVNERLWLGHFDLWRQEGLVMYRNGLLLAGAEASEQQCEALLSTAVDSCERHYQAFQFVVWAGKTAEEALEAVLFETAGEA